MAWRIEEYRTAAGGMPVRTFIAGLPRDAKADVLALMRGYQKHARERLKKTRTEKKR